jgi:hypothetical protein
MDRLKTIIETGQTQSVLDVIHDLLLDGSVISSEVGTHELPKVLSGADSLLLLSRVAEFRL